MNGPARIVALGVALTGMVLSMSGCQQLEARDQLNKGVDAYKSAHYEEAIGHFQKATELDPTLSMAKTYLATALAQNIVPGETTPENIKTANQAIAIYNEVLAKNPDDVNSIKRIAGIYYNINDFEKAKEWQKKVLAVDPKDPEAAYTIGAVDWRQAHEDLLKLLQSAGLNDDGKGNVKAPKKLMDQFKDQDAAKVDEGMKYLQQALANRPTYDDAMAYLNLMYRTKADIDYGNADEVKSDLAQADQWVQKALSTRKLNEEKANKGPKGITMPSQNQ
ncbi:MAG TPA: tetratricopeptide repeat protein [Terriglobales bacterium]|nr:tetratricopeptide repeat protein [Terriglobales bacterium]